MTKFTRYILFKNSDRRPIKITEEQFLKFRPALNRDKFIEVNGVPYSTSSIDSMPKIKEEPLMLAAPDPPPIPKAAFEKLDRYVEKLKAKYSINSHD